MDDQSSIGGSVVDPFGFRKQQRGGGGGGALSLANSAKENNWSQHSRHAASTTQTNKNNLLGRSAILLKSREKPTRLNAATSFGVTATPETDRVLDYASSASQSRRPTIVSASTLADSPSLLVSPPPHVNHKSHTHSYAQQQQQQQSSITTRTAKHPRHPQAAAGISFTSNTNSERKAGGRPKLSLAPQTPLAWKDEDNGGTTIDMAPQYCASPSNTTISQLSASPDAKRLAKSRQDMDGADERDGDMSSRRRVLQLHHHRSVELAPPPNRLSTVSLLDQATAASKPSPSTASEAVSTTNAASRLQQKRLNQVQSELNRAQDDVRRMQEETAAAMVQLEKETHQRMELERQLANLQRESQKQKHEAHEQQKNAPPVAELAAWEAALEQEAAAVSRAREVIERREHDWNELQEEIMAIEEEQHNDKTRLEAWQERLEAAEQTWLEEREQFVTDQEHHRQLMQEENDQIASQQRRLLGTEQRLDAQALAIQERSQQLDEHETQLSELEDRLQQEQQELESAAQELEDKTNREQERYQRMQDAMDNLVQQRKAEEAELARAIQQRRDYEQESANAKARMEQAQQTLSDQVRQAHSELQLAKSQVVEQQRELTTLLQRKQGVVEADEARRLAVVAETAKADQNLTAVLQQLEVAQRERSGVATALAELKRELETVKQQMSQEEKRWHAEQASLDEKAAKLEKLRETAERDAQDMIVAAEKRVATLSQQNHEDNKAKNRELETQMAALDDTARSYERDRAILKEKSDAHQKELKDFNKRVQDFVAVEGREKRLRDELETKVKRLTSLIQKERAEHTKATNKFEQSIRVQQAESEQKLSSVSKRLAAVESNRDEANADNSILRQGIEVRDKDIESLHRDLNKTRHDLSNAQRRAEALQRQESQSDLHQMKRFMERLETQSSVLEQQEKECQQLRADLEARETEYQRRVDALDKERQTLFRECNERVSKERKAALMSILGKPWRREHESISGAFSSWIRAVVAEVSEDDVTLSAAPEVNAQIADMEAEVRNLEEQRDEADRSLVEKERTVREELEREKNSKRDLDRELRVQRKKEQELYLDIERLSKEKEQYRRQSASGGAADDPDKAIALEQREARIKQRETELEQMEKSIDERERQIVEANDRIRSMATQLRQMESNLEAKEARLAATSSHYIGRIDQCPSDDDEY